MDFTFETVVAGIVRIFASSPMLMNFETKIKENRWECSNSCLVSVAITSWQNTLQGVPNIKITYTIFGGYCSGTTFWLFD